MEDAGKTAWWVRRLGVAAVIASLAFALGGLSARNNAPETLPEAAAPSAGKHYGPNPAYRLTPQINRIIHLAAERKKLDDEKSGTSGGTQFKTVPAPKKELAPVPKKQTTPTFKKKETAPVLKKKDTAPVFKKKETAPAAKKKVAPVKKDTAPVLKKETVPVEKKLEPIKKEIAPAIKKEPVPVQKEIAPAETTVPGAPPTEQQLQENEAYCAQNPTSPKCVSEQPPPESGPSEQEQENVEFCAQNPNDPSCSKETPPPSDQEQENVDFCAQNPDNPKCVGAVQKEPPTLGEQPSLGPAPGEDAGKVGSICEQNPQLPQCQQDQETPEPDQAVDGPPVTPEDDEDRPPPDFTPPPIPPGPPPPPPPSDEDEEETTGPTIQTVPETCPADQVAWGDQCVYPGGCPPGQVEVPDPAPGVQCAESCPEGMVDRLGVCMGEGPCFNQGGVSYEGQCLAQCPAGTNEINNRCVAEGACQSGYVGEGPDNCRQCEGAGGTVVDGACQCDEPTYVESPDPNSSAVCEPCNQAVYERQCIAQCPQGTLYNQGFCVTECPEGRVQGEGDSADACVPEECPAGTLLQAQSCVQECGQGYNFVHEGQCLTNCPQDRIEHEGQCLTECPGGTITHQGQCLTECPENTELILGRCLAERDCPGNKLHLETDEPGGQCVDSCPESMLELEGRCIGSAVCGMWGGINYEGQCLESCPEGAVTFQGTGCLAECPSDTINVGGQCTACPEGQTVVNGQCQAECDLGQLPVNGTCVAQTEVGYEDFVSLCVDSLESGILLPGVAGATPEETCQNLIGDMCEEENALTPPSEMQMCLQQPCGEGQENVGGQCLAACAGGAERTANGLCPGECPAGQLAAAGGQCQPCVEGLEVVNGQCAAACLNNAERDANGQCPTSCPEGQVISYNGTCVDHCIYVNAPIAYDGQCVPGCPEGQMFYQGQCRQQTTCSEGTVQRTGNINNVCMDACPEGQYATNTTAGLQCRTQCSGHAEVIEGECVAPCAMGETRGPDGQCRNPCQGEQVFVGGQCRDRCALGDVMGNDGVCRPADCTHYVGGQCRPCGVNLGGLCRDPVTHEEAVQACVNSGYLSPATQDQAACEAAVDDDCAEKTDPSRYGSVPPYCMVAEETVVAEAPPDGEAPPPADEGTAPPSPTDGEAPPPADGEVPPPPEGAAPPPPDETAPPPDETAPPPEETAPPPPDGTVPPPPEDAGEVGTICEQNPQLPQCQDQPPDEGAPPPPPPDGAAPPPPPPVTDGEPPAPAPAKPAKPSVAELKDIPVPLKQPPAKPIAVVIGISDYKDKGIPAVPQAIGNAAHVVRFLKDDLGLDDLRIVTARNASLAELEEIFGGKGDAKGDLHDLVRQERPSEVIVYVSGRALADGGGKDVLLLPADADPKKPETAMSLARLYNHLAAIGVPNLRLYFDPAFAEGDKVVKIQTAPVVGPAGILTPRGWVALSAANDNATVPGDKDRPRTLFTESLIAGLRGIADTTGEGDGDGTITAKELYEFTRDQAAAAAKRGDKQPVPSLYGPPKEPLRTY